MTQVTFTLNNLVLSSLNMRQGDVDVSDLVASMTARVKAGQSPLMQNLRVTEQKDASGAVTGVGEVHVGGRRLRALNQLAKAKIIKKTFEVACAVCDDPIAAMDESIEENVQRIDPHPAEQYLAFAQLAEAGQTVEQIAARHGITELVVRRRLKLGNVSPKLLALYRQNEIQPGQMKSLCLTDDHAVQEAAWFDVEHDWQRNADRIAKKITEGEVASRNNALVSVVGLDAYREAGGAVRADLFAEDGDVYIQDVALLEKLALVAVETKKTELLAEGWKWVEFHPSLSWSEREQWSDLTARANSLSDDDAARVAELEAAIISERDADESDYDKLQEMQGEITDIRAAAGTHYEPSEMALAGVVITVQSGEVVLQLGKVTKADAKAIKAKAAKSPAEGGKGASAGAQEGGAAISAALLEELSAHHTLALRAAILERPDVALVATVHRLLIVTHYRSSLTYQHNSVVTLSGAGYNDPMARHGVEMADATASQRLAAAREAMGRILPENPADLWAFLLSKPQADLLTLLAYASSGLVDALQSPHTPEEKRTAGYDLADALALDMSDYWTATAPTYFSRVGKPVILDAVREVAGEAAAGGMETLKKAEMAQRAEEALDGSRWLPAVLRTPSAVEAVEAEPLKQAA